MFSNEYMREIRRGFDRQMTLIGEEIGRLENGSKPALAGEENGNAAVSSGGLAALRLPLLRAKKQEILDALGGCLPDEAEAMMFLFSAMPISDILEYPAELFLAYARHGVFLWKEGPFAGRVPERLFANYVLHHRVNNEDIADLRSFFYGKLAGRVVPDSMEKTVIEANYWCAQEGTYRSTDGRTQNALTMYSTATGRCGEESTFAVSVLRSIGIPARQVYAPLWTHCDDNHAWVEAWCDGKWIFFGACEPEERLNYGWFIGPASRAMLLHSRWFGPDEPLDPVLGRKGMSRILNHMERYAHTTWLTIRVADESGRPVPDAKVECQVVNAGELRPIAFLKTGGAGSPDCGTVRMLTGYGDLYVTASKEDAGAGCPEDDPADSARRTEDDPADSARGTEEPEAGQAAPARRTEASKAGMTGHAVRYGETKVSMIGLAAGQEAEAAVVLHDGPRCTDGFQDLEFYAPKVGNINDDTLTDEQKRVGLKRNQEAAGYRARKKEAFYDREKAEAVLKRFPEEERAELDELLHRALGNLSEILKFLTWESDCLAAQERRDACADPAENAGGFAGRFGESGIKKAGSWKLEVLRSLREKDLWDIRADILKECCETAAPYAGSMPGWVFYHFLVNPRVANEMVRPCRRFLADHISSEQAEAIRKCPSVLTSLADQWIRSIPGQEYEDLITTPAACLRGGIASVMSKKVFCVTLYRTLGIPARIRMIDRSVEYYRDGRFESAGGEEPKGSGGLFPSAGKAGLTLRGSESLNLTDWAHYSLDRFEKDHYDRVGMWDHFEELQMNEVYLELEPGIYRALTTNRRADGSQLVKYMTFELKAGEQRELDLSLRKISPTALRTEYEVRDLGLKTTEGRDVRLKDLSGSGRALLVWLEVTREPTEHILNELYEKSADFAALTQPLYVVVKKPEDLKDATLARTMAAIPNLKPLLHDFGEDYKVLAEEIGLVADRLPLAMVLEGGAKSVYGDAGYNVGLADMLYRILSAEA